MTGTFSAPSAIPSFPPFPRDLTVLRVAKSPMRQDNCMRPQPMLYSAAVGRGYRPRPFERIFRCSLIRHAHTDRQRQSRAGALWPVHPRAGGQDRPGPGLRRPARTTTWSTSSGCWMRRSIYVHGNHDKADPAGRVRTSELTRWAPGVHVGRRTCTAPRDQPPGAACWPGWRAAGCTIPARRFSTRRAEVRRQVFAAGRRLLTEPAALRPLPGHPDHARAAARHPRWRGPAAPGALRAI